MFRDLQVVQVREEKAETGFYAGELVEYVTKGGCSVASGV